MDGILTAEAAAQLQEGIGLLLSRWAALRMAVENEWGGRDSLQKSQQLGHDLFRRLTQSKEQVYIDDLEDMFDDFMLSLNTEIGDASIEEIAEKLMVMREECLESNFNSIKRLKETNAPSISYVRQAGTNDEDDSDESDGDGDGDGNSGEDISSEMEVDTPPCKSSLDQKNIKTNGSCLKEDVPEVVDGWTVVTSRPNKGNKLNLSTVRARNDAMERSLPSLDRGKRHVDPGASGSLTSFVVRDTRIPPGLHEHRGPTTSSHPRGRASSVGNDKKGDLGKRSAEERTKASGVEGQKNLRKGNEEDRGVSSTAQSTPSLLVDGVNHKDNAGSFWDFSDPGISMKRSRGIIGDFDSVHLISQPTSVLSQYLRLSACQTLSLAHALQAHEERSKGVRDDLQEEVSSLKEEVRCLEAKSKEESSSLQRQLDAKMKECENLHKDLKTLEEKFQAETKSGDLFLSSSAGVSLLDSTKDKGAKLYKASPAFDEDVLRHVVVIYNEVVLDCRRQLREMGVVSEEVVRMIEPGVREVDGVVPMEQVPGDPEGAAVDAEIIEVLTSLAGDGSNEP